MRRRLRCLPRAMVARWLIVGLCSAAGLTLGSASAGEVASVQGIDPLNPPPGTVFRADQVVPAPPPVEGQPPPPPPAEVYVRARPDGSVAPEYANPPPGVVVHVVPADE